MDDLTVLSRLLGLDGSVLRRHVQTPLPLPVPNPLEGWIAPDLVRSVLGVCDGFQLFGQEPWDGFRLWGSQEYGELRLRDDPIWFESQYLGFLPIFGNAPHLTSIRLADSVIVATDWEGRRSESWCRKIADSFQEYIATIILVREAYGDGEMPSDWWHPYAAQGSRYDLDQR